MNIGTLFEGHVKGNICVDEKTLDTFSRDASIFHITPEVVITPEDANDVSEIVKIVKKEKEGGKNISISGRSAGTDMSGGPLTESVVLSFTDNMHHIIEVNNQLATVEPGVFYRDFEVETLKHGWLMPSYPASRGLCAIGGMIMNNAGGEKTLSYGKTEKYVKSVDLVLADGSQATFSKLSREEVEQKKALSTLEGDIYRKMSDLLSVNKDIITRAKPKVSKNSSGYYLWNVIDDKDGSMDLSKLIVGSQGTLGILTKATITGVKPLKYSRLLVIFLHDFSKLGEITETLLTHKPESLESYDDQTLKVAMKFFTDIVKLLNKNIFKLAWQFRPEMWMAITGGFPKLVLMAEFSGDDLNDVNMRMQKAYDEMGKYGLRMRMTLDEEETSKYWTLRRESFNLLRHRMHGSRTAPFIDDIVVSHEKLPEFLPKLESLLKQYPLTYTVAGHVGNGNFHIIPLMDLSKSESIDIIGKLGKQVYALVKEFGGSISGEHNDGLIRTSFLNSMYDEETLKLFEEVKDIFDPLNIFNPGKKVRGNWGYAMAHIDTSHEDLGKKTYMPC